MRGFTQLDVSSKIIVSNGLQLFSNFKFLTFSLFVFCAALNKSDFREASRNPPWILHTVTKR
jgi:hypothetical protein